MMIELTLRKAVPDDLTFIVQLWKEMMDFHTKRDPLFAISEEGPEHFSEFITANMSDDTACVLVAVVEGMVVGYCLGRLEKIPPVFGNRGIGAVFDLAVSGDYRRKGIGRKLYLEIEAWFKGRGVQRIDVRVAISNEVSTNFWSECGFRPYVTIVNKII